MPNILRKPSHTARLPRNGHDVSRRVLFTSSVGHIIPVLYDYLDAGDRVYLNDRLFTRTQPLKTPAFVRCKEHIYYFFVPFSQIDSYHGLAKYNIRDFHNTNDITRSQFNPNVPSSVPYSLPLLNIGSLDNALCGYYTGSSLKSVFQAVYKTSDSGGYDFQLVANSDNMTDPYGIPRIWNAYRLMDMLGYSSVHMTKSLFQAKVNPYLLLVYQKIWYDFFRISTWTQNYPFAYNYNYYIKANSVVDLYRDIASYNNTDNVTRYNVLDLHYHPLKKDFFTNILPSPLSDVTGNNSYSVGNTPNTDGFTSINSLLTSAYGVNIQMPINSKNNPNVRNNFGIDSDEQGARYEIDNTSSYNQYLTTSQLRFLYAYDKLLSITQRAGKHYDDQVLAHLGVKIPSGVSGESYYLGCHSSNLIIGEVVGTAAGTDGEGSSSVLGELAGRGLGASRRNKTIKFRAPDDGFLMALYCCVPDVDYKDYGLDRLNMYRSIMDWPRPEFDRLGMQPLYDWQSSVVDIALNGAASYDNGQLTIGWQYRWSELKLSYDVVHGAFNNTLSDWTSSIWFGQFGNIEHNLYCSPSYLDGIFALNFTPSAENMQGFVGERVLLSSVHVDELPSGRTADTVIDDWLPSNTTDNFSTLWSSSILYSRDPLLHSIDFDYKKVSWMSTYGLPNL